MGRKAETYMDLAIISLAAIAIVAMFTGTDHGLAATAMSSIIMIVTARLQARRNSNS